MQGVDKKWISHTKLIAMQGRLGTLTLLALLLPADARQLPAAERRAAASRLPRSATRPALSFAHGDGDAALRRALALRGGVEAEAATTVLLGLTQQQIASVFGWCISAGSALLYSPILYDVLRKKSAMGLSPVTWVLQTVGSAGMVVYPLKSKYPLSTYFEFITLSVQSAAIFVALAAYGDVLTASQALQLLAAVAGMVAYLVVAAPMKLVKSVQAASIAIMTVSLLPQVARNFKEKSTGGWSPLSAFFATLGNAIRIFTTLSLTQDNLILAGFFVGTALNGLLLASTLAFPAPL